VPDYIVSRLPGFRRTASLEGRRENLSQANKLSRTYAVLLDALNRHRGKGQQKVTVEHVHVHAGGQAVVGVVESPGGWGSAEIRGSTPCKANYPCTSVGGVERGQGAGVGADRRRCRTAGADCTGGRHRALRRVTTTLSSTAATRPRRLPAGERSRRFCGPRELFRGLRGRGNKSFARLDKSRPGFDFYHRNLTMPRHPCARDR